MMSAVTKLHKYAARLLHDTSGNFAIISAILAPVLVGAAGISIDVTNIVASQRQLQEASDSAALAAASALSANKGTTVDQAKTLATDFVAGQMSNFVDQATVDAIRASIVVDIKSTVTSGGTSYKISVKSNYDLSTSPFIGVFGYKKFDVAAASAASGGISEQRSAVSMTLVLDQSGSMLADTGTLDKTQTSCVQYDDSGTQITKKVNGQTVTKFSPCYIKKIDALKSAANLLLTELDKVDPSKPAKYVRTNAIGWSDKVRLSSTFAWGTTNTRSQVIDKLSAGNGTESYKPMLKAYTDLQDGIANSEKSIQVAANNNILTKYIVLMTDGNNNNVSSDTSTRTVCEDAKNKEHIKIYSIAFMAPTRGQQLLNDCSSGAGFYFKAESMSDLLTAFQKIGQDAAAGKTLLTQ